MAELFFESTDRDAHVRLIGRATEESFPVIEVTVEAELVDTSVYESYRARYGLEIRSELVLADLERFVRSLEKFNETRAGSVALDSLGRAYLSFGFEAHKPGRVSFFLKQRSLDRRELVFSGRFSVDSEELLDVVSRFSRFLRQLAVGRERAG